MAITLICHYEIRRDFRFKQALWRISMDLLKVDTATCNKDGRCAAVCPAGIICFSTEKYPEPVPEANDLCIRCGHCVAVCPTASLTHRDMPVEKCPEVASSLLPGPEQCEHFFRARRS